MNIILVAWDDNKLIGKNNDLPWKVKEDLKLFKARTMGSSLIMGKNTFKSIGNKPLPGRLNIVLSRTESGENFVKTWEEALKLANAYSQDVYIIGGSQVYKSALDNNLVDKIIVSKIHGFYKGDTYFPPLDKKWECRTIINYEEFDVQEYVDKLSIKA